MNQPQRVRGPNQHTINVTDLRTETREILENAHFRGWHYTVYRAGQPPAVILDHEEHQELLQTATDQHKIWHHRHP